MVLQSLHRETLAVDTRGSLVETTSTALKNEIDGGRKEDVNKTTFHPSLMSWFKYFEDTDTYFPGNGLCRRLIFSVGSREYQQE